MVDMTVVADAICEKCGKSIPIFKCFPDWGPDWGTGDTCPFCKSGELVVKRR